MNNQMPDIYTEFRYEDLRVFIPVVGTLTGFIIFWFSWQSEKLKERLIRDYGEDVGQAKLVVYTKILGALSMGILPAICYWIAFPDTRLAELGWVLSKETFLSTILWTAGLGLLIIIVTGLNAGKPDNLKYYPQIRARRWTTSMIRSNLLAWTVYLIGYEALFRGVLLFPLIDQVGLWPAIGVNIALYSGTHIVKGLKETLGSIPLCIVLCLICAQTENFWIAAFVHVAMAWTNEIISLKCNPEMQVVKP